MRRTRGAVGRGRAGPRSGTVSTDPALASALALLVLGSQLGCPQLLDDRFESGPTASVRPPGEGDAGFAVPGPSGQDLTPPTVVSATPANGQRGVVGDAPLEIRFSEAMNTSATEASYASTDVPADSVTFSWREDNRVLLIRPAEPLPVASGTDIATVSALQYTYQLRDGASDVAGNRLAPLSISFFVVRQIEQTLDALQDRALTGNWRSDGVYGVVGCEVQDATVCVGDSSSIGEPGYRGFISFDPSALPSERVAIVAAELSLTILSELNAPFDDLGPLHIEKVRFDSIDTSAYEATAEAALGLLSTAADPGDTMRADVRSALQTDAGDGRLNQYRIRFETASNVDGNADVIVCASAGARLRVTYSMP